jgi:pimeloyl-ACP methyl ester carboxylesterase
MTKRRRFLWAVLVAAVVLGSWHLITNIFSEEEKELRSRLREVAKEMFPEQAAEFAQTLGLFFFSVDRKEPDPNRESVVLVHGLDDPGKVWQNLAPDLAGERFNVWLMEYPNDQPILESAELFFEELERLRQLGTERISIVAHSMGGLVAREVLTRPEMDYVTAARDGRVPEVEELIMVATPNHGSQLARFRWFGETRDQFVRLTRGEASWLGGILDGAGEAKVDLLPGSLFLTELNARPHPEGVEMLSIAGMTSPWSESDIDGWIDGLRRQVSADRQKWADEFGENLISMTRGLGDGLVTVESTRLDGVPHRIVDGTHLSVIRNITLSSSRTPPAVPIIVERLKGD